MNSDKISPSGSELDAHSLLKDSKFALSEAISGWGRDQKITDGWHADIKTAAPKSTRTISWSQDGGLQLVWAEPAERVRLWQELDTANVPPGAAGYQLTLKASFPADFDLKESLDWIAILEEDADGRFGFFGRLPLTTMRIGRRTAVISTAQIAKFDQKRQYRLCFQFRSAAKSATIYSVKLTATPLARPLFRGDAAPAKLGTAAPAPVRTKATEPRPTADKPAPTVQAAAPARTPEAPRPASAAEPTLPKPAPQQISPARAARKPRAVVIAWDMGHNPVGRAFLLADMLQQNFDVELIGPMFKRYGSKVWAPIAKSNIPYRTFAVENPEDFAGLAIEFVKKSGADIVYVCKARLPSILMGLLIKYELGCPVVIDVDDHELSFFPNSEPLSLKDLESSWSEQEDIALPFGQSWTRLAESLIPLFDGLVVSNVALQDRFGGTVVRHARDEALFGRRSHIRRRIRKEFGYGEDDRVVLFLGTPRAHKGVFQIAEALEEINDPKLALCIIGSPNDKRIEARLASYKKARIDTFPDQPWERLPELINLADAVCLLQDPTSPIAQYQIPAKLTDALATGVATAVTDVPPFSDIPSPRIVTRISTDQDLKDFLAAVAEGGPESEDYARRSRDYFLGELSYSVNRARLETVFASAAAKPREWRPEWTALFQLVARASGAKIPLVYPSWATEQIAFPALKKGDKFDIAFFWKQNDTGIYGRRHDMLIKYLARHPRVGRIVQFDAPIEVRQVFSGVRTDPDAFLDQSNLVSLNTVKRFMRLSDEEKVARRVFVHRGASGPDSFMGQSLPPKSDYHDWLRACLRQEGLDGPLVSWVTPVVFDYPAIHDAIGFSLTVADLIDDQRAMPAVPEHHRRLRVSYEETLRRANVVFANCAPAKEAFLPLCNDITVVPNAAESRPSGLFNDKPTELASLKGPIIGYVGNLRDRIDTQLLARMANERPEWQIILIGSAHRAPDVLELRGVPNIHFLGVKIYEEAAAYIRAFDVAIMPHLDNDVSRAMNPLKLYVYLSLGVPIVTSAVANIGDISEFASVATDAGDFIDKVAKVLELQGRTDTRKAFKLPKGLSWSDRVDTIVKTIDEHLA